MCAKIDADVLRGGCAQELRRVATEDLGRVEGELQREARREDAELRQQYGRVWARPASAALNSTLLEKVAGAPPAATQNALHVSIINC